MNHVFISYSTKNKPIADRICSYLESNGISCWYAPRNILPGHDWAESIMDAIDNAKVFLLIYSSESNQSRQVSNEVTAAFNAGCTLVPYRVSNEKMCGRLAYYLNSVHWIDAVTASEPENLKQLLSYLKKELNLSTNVSSTDTEAVKVFPQNKPTYLLPPKHALEYLLQQSSSHSDTAVMIKFKLGIDASQVDQQVRFPLTLPHGTGINPRILVLSKNPAKNSDAIHAGAKYAGGEELARKISQEHWFDFDIMVASPEMMGTVGCLYKVLPERIETPSPIMKTCHPYVVESVKRIMAGEIHCRNDKNGIITCPIGRVSFGPQKLADNLDTLLRAITNKKSSAHNCPNPGQFIQSCVVYTDNSPKIPVDTSNYD